MLDFKAFAYNYTPLSFVTPNDMRYYYCKYFILADETGNYSPINAGGWGFPNISISDLTYFNLFVFNPVTKKPFVSTPPSTTQYDLVGTSFLTPPSTEINVTYSLITGGQQTGDLPNGLYVIWLNSIVGSTAIGYTQIALQGCEIVCCLLKLIDKIANEKTCCETIKKYNELTLNFNCLKEEINCLNRYYQTIDITSETYSQDITSESIYKKVNYLYKKCMALVNGKGGCGCGCK
jgi:hypothetical protein